MHHAFEITLVVQKLRVLQHLLVGLRFDACQRLKQFALSLRALWGDWTTLLQALMDAGVFGIAPVFAAQLVVLAIQLFDLVMDGVERADIGRHLFLANFAEFLFLEQAFKLFAQGDEFGVNLIKVVCQRFACLAKGVFQLVGQYQLFFPNLGKFKDHLFQRDVEQLPRVGGGFDGVFEVEQVEVVTGFAVQLTQFVKIQLLQQTVFTLQANQVVEVAGVAQCLFERQHGGTVLNLVELPGKFFGVFDVEAEQDVLDGFDFLRDLCGRFEQVGIVLDLIAQLGLQLVKIVFVGLVEFLADVGKVDHIAVSKILVSAVDSGECLQQVMGLDDATEIELFQSLGIKAREQHVVDKQEVDLACLEVFDPILALVFAAYIVQDQRGSFGAVFQQRTGSVAVRQACGDDRLSRVLRGESR